MIQQPPTATRTHTLFPDTPLLRSQNHRVHRRVPVRLAYECPQPPPTRDEIGGDLLILFITGWIRVINDRAEQLHEDHAGKQRLHEKGCAGVIIAIGKDKWQEHKAKPILRSSERSEEHTSELQSLMRISYAVFCLKKQKKPKKNI